MPTLKEVRLRIASVNSTKQITTAMKMVSASKLRRAQDSIIKLRPYANKLREIIQRVSAGMENTPEDVYFDKRKGGKILMVVFSSNRGLCGVFNASAAKLTLQIIQESFSAEMAVGNVHVMGVGKKAAEILARRGVQVISREEAMVEKPSFEKASAFANELISLFSNKKYDRIVFVFNQFKNAASQVVTSETFLPISMENDTLSSHAVGTDYLIEPEQEKLFSVLIPKSLKIQFYKALLDSVASEHGSRMTAMHKATDNATELIKELKLSYNKARQASITKEILEIVSGAEALKG